MDEQLMTLYAEKHQFAGGRIERALLRLSWEAELLGAGMYETLTGMYPDHADALAACATMERFNAQYCASFGHDAGMHVSLERAEMLRQWGAALARRLRTFTSVAKLMIIETPLANVLYRQLARGAGTSDLRALADKLSEHENAMRDWFRSELAGKPDGGEKIFAYLERHGIKREEAVIQREARAPVIRHPERRRKT
jgi:hypothetical protein